MLLPPENRRTPQVRAASRAFSSIVVFLRMNAIGSGSSSATAARWTIPVISCRSPMARRASRSARSACSIATRASRKDGGAALRCRVTTTRSPRSVSASAVWAPIEPNPPVTRIIASPDAAEGARHPGLEVHQGDPGRPDGDARHARSRLVDLGEVTRGLLRAEEAMGGLGVLGRYAVDLGDLGLAAKAEHLGRRRLGVDRDGDVGVRA